MTTDWKSARTTTPQLLQVARTSKMELEAMLHNETFDMKWRKVTNILHLPNENRTLISRHSGYALPTLQEEPPDIQDTFPPCNTHPHHTNHHLPMKFKPQHGPTAPSKTSGGPPHTMPELQRHPTVLASTKVSLRGSMTGRTRTSGLQGQIGCIYVTKLNAGITVLTDAAWVSKEEK